MKPSMIIGAFAALVSAAPTTVESRSAVDLNAFNQFAFANQDLQYLLAINQFDLQAFAQLSAFNNLQIVNFQSLFSNDVFDVNALLQLQQVAMLAQLAQLGVFSNFDLSSVNFNVFDLGLANAIGGFNVGSIIDVSLVPQIQTVIAQTQFQTIVV
ncbi:hypothetical protein GGR57DRAFT_507698 [Xylariaceae sp. FL1272]|nr:hypothetical protein GGR57DRAFT_507698 [Xylariaceae sp. FL1272]